VIRKALAIATAALLVFGGAAPALAQECPAPKTTLSDLEDEVMCPRCGTPLNVVDSEPQAQRERAFIQSLIDQCKSKKEIKAALVAQFGPEILAEPPREGFDLAAYWVPILLGAVALIGIGTVAVKWRGGRPGSETDAAGNDASDNTDTPDMDEEEAARLDRDLERYEL
jgi:cytochrome c-type biogenesis protein CcmH/NrfF